ncbi:hypothetical protein N8515_00385 [bacterium]|jgi:hypothetical protein|nr:hypothetical protein [bacterium]
MRGVFQIQIECLEAFACGPANRLSVLHHEIEYSPDPVLDPDGRLGVIGVRG